MLLKKNKGFKTTLKITNDISHAFNKIISQNEPIYFITISNTNIKTSIEMRFILTNKIFNKLHKAPENSFEVINYLYVIEYPEKVSRGNLIPDNCEVHTHIILGTTLKPQQIEYYIKNNFTKPDIDIKRIDKREDKTYLKNYLSKQENLLTDDNYNYKIKLNN